MTRQPVITSITMSYPVQPTHYIRLVATDPTHFTSALVDDKTRVVLGQSTDLYFLKLTNNAADDAAFTDYYYFDELMYTAE